MIHILNQKDEIVDYFDINDGDILNPEMVRNIETLEDTFDFSVATKRSINVQERNRVIIKDNENQYREFIIMQYESNLDGYTEVSCVGSHLEDFQTAKPLEPQSLQSYTTNQAIEFMSSDTGWEVADDNEWGGSRTTSWSSWKDRLSLLKQLQTTYDMRLSFYIELGTNTVKHRFVKLVKVNPIFNGEEIVYGENMIDLKRSVDFTDVATALVAIGPENDDGERRILEVHDDEAQEQLGLPYRYLWQVYEPESEDGDMTESRLRTLATTKLNKIKQASVEYTIQSTQLDVAIGDMIRVKNEDFTPELYVEAEIIEIKYNPYTELCDYKFGILTEYSRDEVYERFYDLLQSLRKRLSNIRYDTENIITEMLEVELDGLERYIEKSPNPPENPREGDFWLDTSDSEVGVLYRWENGEWVKSSVTQAEEIGAITREESMYDSISNTLELLAMQHSSHMNEYYVTMDNEYFIDDDLKQLLTSSYNTVDGIFNTLINKFNQMTVHTATMGRLMEVLELITDYRNALNMFRIRLSEANQEIERYFALLQSQYSEEKYNEILHEVADKFGLSVSDDGKLMGNADYINSMNQLEQNLQQQIDDAKNAFDELEIGGRNLIKDSTDLKLGSSNANVTVSKVTDGIHENVFKSETEVAGASSYFTTIFQQVSEQPKVGQQATLSLLVRGIVFEGRDNSLNIYYNSGTKNQTMVGISEEYQWLSVTFDVHSESTRFHFYPQNFSELYIARAKLEIGNIATDWTPAPEDTDNKITNLNQEIININGRLASTITEEVFNLLEGTVTQQGTLISQTADELKSKADSSRVDTINNTVTEQGTLISQTSEELKLKANQKDLDTLNNTVSEQGTEITANAQEIALRAKESDLNTVTGRVDKAEADIEVNAREISSRVKDVDYQTDKDGIIGRLSGAESSLTQQSKLIETKVSSTELTQAIDDIDIGGVNLANWTETSVENKNRYRPTGRTNDVNIVTLQGEKFTQVRELNGESGVGTVFGVYVGRWDGLNNSYFNIEKDQEYTLTFRGQNSSTTDEFTYVFIMRDDNMENPESTTSGANQGVSSAIVDRVNVESGYGSRYKFSFKANWNSKKAYILIGTHKKSGWGAGTSFWFRFKELQLEKGNKATDWSLSQKDTLKQFEDLDDRITTHDTQFEQTDQQIALRATMTDVNKSDETLSRALSELIIDTSNGLKFQWDSNGRLASYSVGKDGIQFDGSKIKFTASDSIMLQIADAKKAGTDAQGVASDAKSKIDNLDLSGTNLVSGTNFAIKENVDRLDTPWGGASYTSEKEYLLVLHNNLAENSPFGLRTFRNDFVLTQGAEYTLSFEAYSNVNSDESFSYVYLYRYGGSNQGRFTLNRELIGSAGGSTGIGYDLYRYTVTFKNTTGTDPANLLIATRGTGYSWFRIKNVMLTRGDVAVPYNVQGHKVVDTDTLIPSINGDKNGWTISGRKIDLVGDVNMVNGEVKVRNLTASSGSNKLELTASGLVMDGSVGNLSMGSDGIVYKDSRGVIKYEMNENFVRSSTFGTTTANIYMAASNGYEVRFVDIRDVPGLGTVDDYRYIDGRLARLYTSGIANNTRYQTDLRLGADGDVKIMNHGLTTLGTLETAGLKADFLDLQAGNTGNLYIRPAGGSEVRITARGTTSTYRPLRASALIANHLYSNTSQNLYIRTDNEIQFTSHGSTSNYRDIRGMFAKFDALDVNTGSHIYTRVHGASAELRVTARGTTDQYRDLRFRNWTSVSSEIYKTDITEWNYDVLDIIKNEVKIYQYKYKDDVTEGDNVMYQRGLVLERETPSEFIKGDGINQYEVTSWTLKGVQELAQENDILKDKVEELQNQMAEVMALLNKE